MKRSKSFATTALLVGMLAAVAAQAPATFKRTVLQQGDLSAPGREAVIVGSDDMSLMAVQSLAEMGVRVRAVLEERPYRLGYMGLEWLSLRSRRIPLLLHHKILEIQGWNRVTGVLVTALDERGAHKDEPFLLACDTVIFSGEFVPENALARQTNLGIDPNTQGPRIDQDFQTDVRGIFA